MIELNQIILADCMDIMKSIPDKSIDLILTDPPYGKNADKGTNGFGTSESKKYKGNWDSKLIDRKYFSEMHRISKNIIVFGFQYYINHFNNTNCLIAWDKVGTLKGTLKNPFADFEIAHTNFKRTNVLYTVVNQGFIKDSKDIIQHPTQKPTELFQMILKDFSNENDTVLDCFSGSGTTAIACIRTNRNYICIEKDKEYFEKSVERVNKELIKIKLF